MAILVSSILINPSYFQLNAFKPGIGFRGLRVFWHCPCSCAIQTEDIAAILILSLIFYYWHNVMEADVSDLWIFRVIASADGCLSISTTFFIWIVTYR